MDIKKPYLFLEVNDNQFIFLVVKYSEDLSFEILYSTSLKSAGVKDGKIIDTEIAFKTIKENLDILEKKLKYTFKSTTIINDQYNFDCINISGFKKLGGSQILDEDISYILNDIKKSISDNEPKKTLIHLFNTNFVLDQTALNNLPIGLHGEFYNHHLTFFLLPKNDLKNLKVILNKCNLNIERIVLKAFTSGIDKINRNETKEIFCTVGLGKEKSNISIFKDLSFAYSENFLFGTEMIKKDISKLCSLENSVVEDIISNICFDKIDDTEDEIYLDEKYFVNMAFRKISLVHLKNIIIARLNELIDIIYEKNINLKNLKDKNQIIYLSFEDEKIFTSLKESFKSSFFNKEKVRVLEKSQDEHIKPCLASAELISRGWEKEAIPIIHRKKSIISRIFSGLFG